MLWIKRLVTTSHVNKLLVRDNTSMICSIQVLLVRIGGTCITPLRLQRGRLIGHTVWRYHASCFVFAKAVTQIASHSVDAMLDTSRAYDSSFPPWIAALLKLFKFSSQELILPSCISLFCFCLSRLPFRVPCLGKDPLQISTSVLNRPHSSMIHRSPLIFGLISC